MPTRFYSAQEAKDQIDKKYEELLNRIENAILIAISEIKCLCFVYLTEREYEIVINILEPLGYVIKDLEISGSTTHKFEINWTNPKKV